MFYLGAGLRSAAVPPSAEHEKERDGEMETLNARSVALFICLMLLDWFIRILRACFTPDIKGAITSQQSL